MSLLRRLWRQLTNMRTALILLFLLALAAIPGSLLPQSNLNIEKVAAFYRQHATLAPWLDKVYGFEVYSSPWFAAIYLLLFTSLIGCVLPRMKQQFLSVLRPPPAVPKNLDRLPLSRSRPTSLTVAEHAERLRRGGFRVAVRGDEISAEKGYVRETGNLLFHTALVILLVGVALGSWYGWHGNRLVVKGADGAFCNTLQQYDDKGLGARVTGADLTPFCLQLDEFSAHYLENGQPLDFAADITYTAGGATKSTRISVNQPLRLPKANVYLLGHGYAVELEYTDPFGRTQRTTAPFLYLDQKLTSSGAVTFPDANLDPATGKRAYGQQLGFQGVYLPTLPADPSAGASAHPEERDPGLMLVAYRGDLGVDNGLGHSVYTLDQRQIDTGRLKPVGEPHMFKRGDDLWRLDDGSTVKFLGTKAWATLSVRYDPGEPIVLAGAILLLVGLMPSLMLRARRRIFLRVSGGQLTAGALARNEYPGLEAEFDRLIKEEE